MLTCFLPYTKAFYPVYYYIFLLCDVHRIEEGFTSYNREMYILLWEDVVISCTKVLNYTEENN